MKLRYYLRGLGIGMIVTALILGIAGGEKEQLSDAEIKERAAMLGMVDSGSLTLSSLQQTTTNTSQEEAAEASKDSQQSEEAQGSQENAQSNGNEEVESGGEEEVPSGEDETVRPDGADASKESAEVSENDLTETENTTQNTQIREIIIESGVHSYDVSKQLEEVGLIEDAEAFDQYLCDNGYSKSINSGTYKIEIGISDEEIAKIICRKR